MSELKPCPFCGNQAEIKKSWVPRANEYAIGCSNFECEANNCEQDEQGGFNSYFMKLEDAVAHWNTRPLESAAELRGERKGVVKGLDMAIAAIPANILTNPFTILIKLKSDYLQEVESGKAE
jgi:hypothetical protein